MRIATAWSLAMLTSILPAAASPGDDVRSAAAHVERASVLLSGTTPQMPAAFASLVRAIAELAPDLAVTPQVRQNLLAADELLRRGDKRDNEAIALLQNAYKELHGGAAFRVTAQRDDIDQLSGELRRKLETASSLLTQGKPSDAANHLLDLALTIVTPVQP